MNGLGIVQIGIIAAVMVAQFIYTVITRAKYSRYENFREIVESGFSCLYIIAKSFSFLNIDIWYKEYVVGGIMAVSILVIDRKSVV